MKNKIERNKHHLFIPRSRGGSSLDTNLLLIKINKHRCWHDMWDIRLHGRQFPRKLEEILTLLRKANPDNFHPSPQWKILWGDKNVEDVLAILERVKRIKIYQRFYYRN